MKDVIKKLQLHMLRIQQGVWHKKGRVIIVFEGVDAAGKGGAIRKITETLDPRGVRVHPIGPPTAYEQGKHWLYRFWLKIPSPGIIAIFDRSWYGRILVERVDKLTDKKDWKRAYEEINQFERMLKKDGVTIIKIFLQISKKEQLERFEDRIKDSYKQWKLTEADLSAREKWKDYSKAYLDMAKNTSEIPWFVIETDDKDLARSEVLKVITKELRPYEKWMESKVAENNKKELLKQLNSLK